METLGRSTNPPSQDRYAPGPRIFLFSNQEILRFMTKQGTSQVRPRLSTPTAPYCSHLLIFLSDQPLGFWICPWRDSRDGEVGTTLSCQFAEGKGKGTLVSLGAPQHLLGLSLGLVEETKEGLCLTQGCTRDPSPASSDLAFGHTCDFVPSPPGGSCSGCTVPGSSHSVSLASHP